MLISCEKCSTTYVLDEALIPPQGAPVQCTRCGHVFTAKVGAPPPAPQPAVAPRAPAASNTTMMFGAPTGGAAGAAAPPRSTPGAKQTMVFGTPAANAAGAQPPAPQPPQGARNTMMFGGAPSSAPNPGPPRPVFSSSAAPQPAKNQTMMFGTPASNAAPGPGAAPPSIAPASSSKTLVFGSGPAAPPPPSSKQTMVFGTPMSNAAGGAPAPSLAAASKQTMVFGSPVSSSTAQTLPPEGDETLLEAPGQSSRTVLFGTGQPQQVEAPPAAAPKSQTMMFGQAAIPKVTAGTVELAGYAAEEGKQESTQRVDVEAVMEEQEDQRSVAETPAELPPRHDRTQRFAMSDIGGAAPAGAAAVQDRHNRTQRFVMSQAEESAPPSVEYQLEAEPTLLGDPTPEQLPQRGDIDLNITLPPDADPPGVSVLHDPATAAPAVLQGAFERPVSTTLANLSPLLDEPAPLPLELPPEPIGPPADLRVPVDAAQLAADDAAALRAIRGGGGAGKVVVIVLVLVALGLAGVLAWRLVGKGLLGSAVPVEALKSTDAALAALRFDDHDAQDAAMAQLEAVLAKHPEVPEAHAALVIASSFRFDDAQARVNREELALRELKRRDGSEAAQAELLRQLETDRAAAATLKAQLEAQFGRLQQLVPTAEPKSPAGLAMLRAEGLARGVLGDAEALTRAEAYRQRFTQRDDWVDLIEPEYALNGGSSPAEAIAQLKAVKGREANSTFLRPYVLLARLQLKVGDLAGARDELEQVSAMNARHALARELLASLEQP